VIDDRPTGWSLPDTQFGGKGDLPAGVVLDRPSDYTRVALCALQNACWIGLCLSGENCPEELADT